MPLVIFKGPANALTLAANSPVLSYGDRVKATDIYKGPQALCDSSMLPRGTFGTGFRTGWVVNQSTCTNEKGTIGTLTIEWEAGGAYATQPLPVGDFRLEPQELYPKIERAAVFQSPTAILPDMIRAAYNALFQATNDGTNATSAVAIINTAAGLTYIPGTGGSPGTWSTPSTAQATQITLANKLLAKLARGEETFYLTAQRYIYYFFSYTLPALSEGGTIETPDGPLAGNLPPGFSWLRLADHSEPAGVNGSMYKITRTYLGGPALGGIGYWDSEIYS